MDKPTDTKDARRPPPEVRQLSRKEEAYLRLLERAFVAPMAAHEEPKDVYRNLTSGASYLACRAIFLLLLAAKKRPGVTAQQLSEDIDSVLATITGNARGMVTVYHDPPVDDASDES